MGLAEDVSHFLALLFSFVICVAIAFIYGWQLTLIVISYLPIVFATNIFIGKVSAKQVSLDPIANLCPVEYIVLQCICAFGDASFFMFVYR